MKRVSFKVAKALKEAGYPQGQEDYAYRSNGETYLFENMFDHIPDYCCDAPTYIDVWLWLWREQGIKIDTTTRFDSIKGWLVIALITNGRWTYHVECSDPEGAIVSGIEYLVDNDLIK